MRRGIQFILGTFQWQKVSYPVVLLMMLYRAFLTLESVLQIPSVLKFKWKLQSSVVLFILLFKLVSQFNSADKRKLISCGLYLVFRNITNSLYSHVLLELFLSSSSSLSLSPSMSSVRLNKELLQTTMSSNAKTRGFSDNCSGCQIKGGNLVNVSILLSCNHVSPSVFQRKKSKLRQQQRLQWKRC